MAKVYDDEQPNGQEPGYKIPRHMILTPLDRLEARTDLSDEEKRARAIQMAQDSLAKGGYSGKSASKGELKDRETVGRGSDGEDGESGLRKRWQQIKQKKKQAIFGGILGLGLLGGGFGLFTITSGPFQLIHAGQLLAGFHMGPGEDFSDSRSSKFLLYALAGKAAKGRLGVIRNLNADRWERKLNDNGLKSVYQQGTQRLAGYQIIDEGKARAFTTEMESAGHSRIPGSALNGVDYQGNASGIRASDGDIISIKLGDYKAARALTHAATKSIGTYRVSSWMAARTLIKRGGVNFHPLKNEIRRTADRLAWRKQMREARAEALRNGVSGVDGASRDGRNTRSNLFGKIQQFVNAAKGPLIAIAVVCGAKTFSSSIDAANLQHQFELIRMGMDRVTSGSQVQASNDINLDIVGVYVDDLYDEVNKTSYTQDPGIQYENGEPITGTDLIANVKPSAENQKPWFFDIIDLIPTDIASLLGPIGLPAQAAGLQTDICAILDDVSKAISDFPVIGWVLERIQDAINVIVRTATGKTLDDWMQIAIQFFATGGVNLLAEGAERGGLENVGVRLAANNQFQAMGGRELSPQEGSDLKLAALEERKQEFARASIYDRYFNLYESRSAAANVAMALPTTRTQFIASVQKLPSSFASTATKLLGMNKAYAGVARGYDYGFPLYGFSLDEQTNEAVADPYANENYMLEGDRLERMNIEYGQECFFMTVTRNGDLEYGESGNFHDIPAKCKDTNNIELLHYRFYLADLITGHTLNCYEGDQESCIQIGMAVQQTTGTPTTPGSTTGAKYVHPLEGSTYRCTSGFGPRWGTQHNGVDMALPVGNRVLAPTSGTVKRAGPASGYGLVVVILGDDGFYYELGHLSSISAKEGDIVKAGDEVAKSGNTGQSTGPHLHLSVATGFFTGRIDPEPHMASHGVTLCLQ